MIKSIEKRLKMEKLKKRKVYIGVIGLMLAAIALLFLLRNFDLLPGSGSGYETTEPNGNQGEDRIPVTAYKTSRVKFDDTLAVLGNVEGGTQVELNFEKEGRIEKINCKEGDFVKKGAVIALLDMKEVVLKMEQARIEYVQHKKLFEAGVIISAKLEQAKNGYEQAKVEHDKMMLKAPFDGVVSSIEQKEGEVVNPTKKIVSLFDTQEMAINIGITENDINKLFMDQSAVIDFDAIPETAYEGRVSNIDPNIDPITRMMTLMITVNNENALILPGMFARIKINIYSEENALVVPSMALSKTEEGYLIFVIEEGNMISVRNVEVAYLSSDYASISTGLNEGELIVVDKLDRMKEDVVVEVLNLDEYTTHTPGKTSEQ